MEILLELLLELILQLCGELLAELGLRSLAQPFRREPNIWAAALGYLLLGGVVGALSVWLMPEHLMRDGWPRLANLVVTPVLAGLAMSLLGLWRARRGEPLLRIDRFACGYLFALAVAVVRYNFAG